MDFNQIIMELDTLYDQDKMEEAYSFLIRQITEATKQQENLIVIALLSELVSHCRVTAKFNEGNQLSQRLIQLIEAFGLKGTIHDATASMNIATFYRVAGRYNDSLRMYQRCEEVYQAILDIKDERYISFYNNISLLYQEVGKINEAIDYANKAILLQEDPNRKGITYTNISEMYFGIEDIEEGKRYLDLALNAFKEAGYPDSHYLAAYAIQAHYYYLLHEYDQAILLYQEILDKIEAIYGKNHDYQVVEESMQQVIASKNTIKGLDLCEMYYHSVKDELLEGFEEYKSSMCFGLFGYGSDCLGYDDPISRDHDFGPGFLILLPQEVYSKIGVALQARYNQLPDTYMGYTRKVYKEGRVGVMEIHQFFERFVTFPIDYLTIEDYDLLCCINGRIFDDYLGEVSRIRQELEYYPDFPYKVRLAQNLVKMSQTGQYNYYRMKQRDEVGAISCIHEFIDYTIHVAYLLERRYEPYYKWKYYGLKNSKLKECIGELMRLKDIDENIQKICELVIIELNLKEINSPFVEDYGNKIMEEVYYGK